MKPSQPPAEYFRIFVGGLSFDVDNHRLRDSFAPFGSLKKALIIKDQHSGLSRGYGFVTFSSRLAFEAAMRHPVIISGRRADCHQVLTKGALKEQEQRDEANKIFVGGISQHTTAEDLSKFFARFGLVRDARILFDGKSGKSRGFGFVLFRDEASADQVLQAAGLVLKGKTIEVKKFSREKAQELETQQPLTSFAATPSKSPREVASMPDAKPSKCILQPPGVESAKKKPKKRHGKKQPPRLESMSTSSEKDSPFFCASKAQPQRREAPDYASHDEREERPRPQLLDARSAQQQQERFGLASSQRFSISGFYSSTQSLSQDCGYLGPHQPRPQPQARDYEHSQWGLHDYRLWHPSAGTSSSRSGWQSSIPGKFCPDSHL